MAFESQGAPSRREIAEQIARIKKWKRFKRGGSTTALLEFVASASSDGNDFSEFDIGIKVFDRSPDWAPALDASVRVGWFKLKRYLKEYYGAEGREDLVSIEIPEDRTYRFDYRYSSYSAAAMHYRAAVGIFERTFPDYIGPDSDSVFTELKACICCDPQYAPVYAKSAEIRVLYCLCDEAHWFSAASSLSTAESNVIRALELNNDLWLAHIVNGAIHCCRFEWDMARDSFHAALHLSDEAEGHFFYFAYLMALGNLDAAKRALAAAAKFQAHNVLNHAKRALFKYLRREYAEHHRLRLSGLEAPPDPDPLSLELGRQVLYWNNWLIELLMACVMLETDSAITACEYAQKALTHSRVSSFYGLVCLIRRIGIDTKTEEFSRRFGETFELPKPRTAAYSPVNRALECLSLGHEGECIEWLQKAVDSHEPTMVWLHLWPFLDPLRDRDDFKALIARMNLPAQALE